MKKILVIGGLGYVGTQLVPKLIEKNYIVSVYDLGIYGCHLKPNSKLKVIKGDIRNIEKLNDVIKDGLNIDEFGHPNEKCMEIISNKFYDKLKSHKKVI